MRRYGDEIRFVGMAGRDEPAPMRQFVERYGLQSMETVVDETGELWSSIGILGQPAWIFVDDTGRVETYQSALPESDLEGILDAMIDS